MYDGPSPSLAPASTAQLQSSMLLRPVSTSAFPLATSPPPSARALFPHRVPVQPYNSTEPAEIPYPEDEEEEREEEEGDDGNGKEPPTRAPTPSISLGKSPMDGTRNYLPGSLARQQHCSSPLTATAEADVNFPLNTTLCSFGPELVFNAFDDFYAAHLFHEVCLTFNTDSQKQVQRGLVVFDPQNDHHYRCVACPNPVECVRWGRHECGLMWNHQINARSLGDLKQCMAANKPILGQLGQRQSAVAGKGNHLGQVRGGTMLHGAVLELSFTRGNPGHQFFDAVLSLLPILFPLPGEDAPFRVAVLQSPDCSDKEWICALLRQIGFFDKHALVPVQPHRVACFHNLIVPKWGMSRETYVPAHYLHQLRRQVHESFGLRHRSPPSTLSTLSPLQHHQLQQDEPINLMLYAHDTVSVETNEQRRMWLGMRAAANHTSITSLFTNVQVVDDFAALPLGEQGRAFYNADVIVMPHGGQMGNIIFAREGTVVVEAACYPYSHLGMSGGLSGSLPGSLPKNLGLVHIVLLPCECQMARDVDSNFYLGPESILKLYHMVKPYKPGTYYFGRRRSDEDLKPGEVECFGDRT